MDEVKACVVSGRDAADGLTLSADSSSVDGSLLFVLTAWTLDALLRPVSEPVAPLLLVLNAIGVAVP